MGDQLEKYLKLECPYSYDVQSVTFVLCERPFGGKILKLNPDDNLRCLATQEADRRDKKLYKLTLNADPKYTSYQAQITRIKRRLSRDIDCMARAEKDKNLSE